MTDIKKEIREAVLFKIATTPSILTPILNIPNRRIRAPVRQWKL